MPGSEHRRRAFAQATGIAQVRPWSATYRLRYRSRYPDITRRENPRHPPCFSLNWLARKLALSRWIRGRYANSAPSLPRTSATTSDGTGPAISAWRARQSRHFT